MKIIRHFLTITKHRFIVRKLCFKVGLYWQGLTHDLSKYSFKEFFISAKNYSGKFSPINNERAKKGYSEVWLHHKGRNKHHQEYWYDYAAPDQNPVIPYKYTIEMICDNLAAGMTYQGKNWTKEHQLEYYLKVRMKILQKIPRGYIMIK